MPLVVKVYDQYDKSVLHGFPLRYIQYEFIPSSPTFSEPHRTQLISTSVFRL